MRHPLLLLAFCLLAVPRAHASPSSLAGRSGALRAVLLHPGETLELPCVEATFESVQPGVEPFAATCQKGLVQAPPTPGTWRLVREGNPAPVTVITLVPASRQSGGTLNGYRIGTYPRSRNPAYAAPSGYVEVVPENKDLPVSAHLTLGAFLTKGQADVWPKYVALDLAVVDKLELILKELRAMGVPAESLHVMSGYRPPADNGPGGKGRASNSRHIYGDAADVWVDDDRDGEMDDLDRDGKIGLGDAAVMLEATERVERRHPSLVGGAGIYRANRSHGPFLHVDTRGWRARWGAPAPAVRLVAAVDEPTP